MDLIFSTFKDNSRLEAVLGRSMPTMTNLLNLKMKQWPTLFVVNLRPRHVEQNKCDQIWLNFATLVKFSKSLAIFEGLFGYCQISLTQGGTIFALLDKFLLVEWSDISKLFYPSGHTEQNFSEMTVA